MNSTESKIGLRRAQAAQNDRSFKRGTLMFIEGELSTEMYIIRSGKIRILRQEGENTIELAVLGPGSVLGELSLLDHQPRGATAQVVEDTVATVVDEALLERTMGTAPSWLANIIRVVVKRLRDTMKRTSDDVVRKNVGGVVRILLLLYDNEDTIVDERKVIALAKAKEMIYAVIGLGGSEAENVFVHLILKDMVLIRKNAVGQEYIIIKEYLVLQSYLNYLRAKSRGAPMLGESLSDKAGTLMDVVQETGERNGKRVDQQLTRVGTAPLEAEWQRRGQDRTAYLDALDELVACKAVAVEEDAADAKATKYRRVNAVLYNKDVLRKLMLFRVWLPTFQEEVQF
jgi:CRP-like cAMP-binding protein